MGNALSIRMTSPVARTGYEALQATHQSTSTLSSKQAHSAHIPGASKALAETMQTSSPLPPLLPAMATSPRGRALFAGACPRC